MKALPVLFSILLSTAIQAAEVAVVLDDSKPATYLVTIDAAGVVTVSPLRVVRPGPAPTPQPPGPVVLTERGLAIKAVVDKMQVADKEQTAQAIAQLYRELAKVAKSGQVKDQATLAKVTSMATDSLLTKLAVKEPEKWKPVRDKLGEQWTALVQEGASVGEYGKLLDEAASGLEASTPLRALLNPETLAMILEIVRLILQLLNK